MICVQHYSKASSFDPTEDPLTQIFTSIFRERVFDQIESNSNGLNEKNAPVMFSLAKENIQAFEIGMCNVPNAHKEEQI